MIEKEPPATVALFLGCASDIVSTVPQTKSPAWGILCLRCVLQLMSPLTADNPRRNLLEIVFPPTRRQLPVTGKDTITQYLGYRQRSIQHTPRHRRCCTSSLLLPPSFHVVPPHQEYRQPFRTTLTSLRPGDRLPFVICTRMANQEIS